MGKKTVYVVLEISTSKIQIFSFKTATKIKLFVRNEEKKVNEKTTSIRAIDLLSTEPSSTLILI